MSEVIQPPGYSTERVIGTGDLTTPQNAGPTRISWNVITTHHHIQLRQPTTKDSCIPDVSFRAYFTHCGHPFTASWLAFGFVEQWSEELIRGVLYYYVILWDTDSRILHLWALVSWNYSARVVLLIPVSDLSHLKALGRPEGALPQDVCIHFPIESFVIRLTHVQIVIEAFVSLVIGILGASLNAPELKEITWRSEMRKRYMFFFEML